MKNGIIAIVVTMLSFLTNASVDPSMATSYVSPPEGGYTQMWVEMDTETTSGSWYGCTNFSRCANYPPNYSISWSKSEHEVYKTDYNVSRVWIAIVDKDYRVLTALQITDEFWEKVASKQGDSDDYYYVSPEEFTVDAARELCLAYKMAGPRMPSGLVFTLK